MWKGLVLGGFGSFRFLVTTDTHYNSHHEEISSFVYQNIDPNRASAEMDIDIYVKALNAVVQKLEAFGQGEL